MDVHITSDGSRTLCDHSVSGKTYIALGGSVKDATCKECLAKVKTK